MKPKLLNAGSSVCGAMSILGSWQVCHNVCLGIVAVLTALGIAVQGMPLFFLTKVAVPFWTAAVVLLGIALTLVFVFHMPLSRKVLLANSGLLVAGVPFQATQQYNVLLWSVGGTLLIASIVWALADRRKKMHKV